MKASEPQIKMGIMGCSRVGLMLMLLVAFPYSTGACPRPCACYVPTEVHCTFRSLLAVPVDIPKQVERINLGFNTINQITDISFGGLRKLELLMIHGNNVHKIPDGAFQDLVSLQVLKMSYNKVRVITGHTFSGLTGLIRLHLDHNRIEFIHPDAFNGMTSLRLLHLEGNQLQKLHPATFSTFSLLEHFSMSTLKHLYLSDNLLSTLPKDMLKNMPELESLFLYGNPWSCDCRISWLQDWRAQSSGVIKCKKDRKYVNGQLCHLCASPQHLKGKDITDLKEFTCTGPAISSPGRDISHEQNIIELLPIDSIKPPFGNVSLNLSDEHGSKVDLICQISEPREPTKITWNYTKSLQIAANMTLFFDVDCPMDRKNYESLWRLLAYYSEVPVYLQREIMLSKEPELSYRYRQDIEKEVLYYTGVRANVLAQPTWLMQSFMSIQLNRPYSSPKNVRLILNTQMSTTTDRELIRRQKRPWVMIEHHNRTQTTFSSIVGGIIEMDCNVQSSGNAAIQWILSDGSKIKAASSRPDNKVTVSSTGKLHIKSVDHADSGVYYCIAEVLGDIDILPFRLSVFESSTPLPGEEVGSALTKFVGESASLPCVTMATPGAVVNWILPDGSILNSKTNTSRASVYSNGTLFIPYSQLNNNGYHKCVAMNQHGVDVLATKLTVLRRKGIQPLRQYPIRPQSAAGVSTKVKAFLEDMDQASGDDSSERTPPSRSFINRRRGPNARKQGPSFGNIRRRRPFRKGIYEAQSSSANHRSINTKNKIDPQKWADILAKIREKTSTKNTSLHIIKGSTPLTGQQTVNLDNPESIDNTEGSSPDDASPQEESNSFSTLNEENQHVHKIQTVTVTPHIEEQNNNIQQIALPELDTSSGKVTDITNPTSDSNYMITEINVAEGRHVSTHSTSTISEEKMQSAKQKEYTEHVIMPESKRDKEFNFSGKPSVQSQIGDFDSGEFGSTLLVTNAPLKEIPLTSNIKQGTPLNSSQSRAKDHWSSRRRFGGRRRIKFRRPFSNLTTSRPSPASTAVGVQFPSVSMTTDPTTPAGGTTVYSTTKTTAHTYATIQRVFTDGMNKENTISLPNGTIGSNVHKVKASDFPQIHEVTSSRGLFTPPSISETSTAESGVLTHELENEDISSSEKKETITSAEEKMDEYMVPTGPTSTPDLKTIPLTTAQQEFTSIVSIVEVLQKAKNGTATNIGLTLSPGKAESHFGDVLRENDTLKITSSAENARSQEDHLVTSVLPQFASTQDYPLLRPNENFKEQESVKNQGSVSSTLLSLSTTETLTKSTISVEKQTEPLATSLPITNNENDMIFFLNSNSVSEENQKGQSVPKHEGSTESTVPLIVPETSTDITPTITLPITTTMISTTTKEIRTTAQSTIPLMTSTTLPMTSIITTTLALRLTHSIPLPDNRIPFYSQNPETNYIDTRHSERIPSSNNRYPYYHNRNPSVIIKPNIIRTPPVTSSVDLSSLNNIKSTTTPKTLTTTTQTTSSNPTAIPSTTQPNNKIQIGGSINRQTSPVLLSQRPQMRPRITTAKIHTITVNAGTDVQVPCDSVGEPKPFLTWTKVSTGAVMTTNTRIQRFEVQSNGTFVIHNIQLQDRGQYLCSVRNLYGIDKMMVTLVVLAQVPRMLLPRHQDVTVYLGNSALMECQAQGLPTPNISWVLPDRSVVRTVSSTEQRVMLFANGTLLIKQTNYLDKGIYKCIASNAAGTDMLSVRLQIAALPPMIQQQRWENHTVSNGQTVYIHCSAHGAPSPAIRWVTVRGTQIRPSQFVDGNLFVFPNGTLYIRSPTEKDSGNYECVAVNSVGVAKRTVNLQVKRNSSSAKITSTSSQSIDVSYGGQLSLNCTATGIPNPRIIWRTPSKKLVDAYYSFDHRITVLSNGTLTIKSVMEKDKGDYLCVARNKMGDDFVLLTVNVMMKAAKIEHKPLSSHKVSYGGELRVDCVASGLPDPEITWSLPDGTMVNSILQSDDNGIRTRRYVVFDNGTLYFNEVGMKEEGDYTCYAENHIGKDEMKVHIKVVADPPVIRNNTYMAIKVPYGETAILTCSAKGEPTPTITWMSPTNRIILPVSDKYRVTNDGTLLIHKVQKLDRGNYTCSARNIVGMDRKVVHVDVIVSPPVINGLEKPSTIKKTAVKDQNVLLDCKAEGNPVPRIMWALPNNVVLPTANHNTRITVFRNGTLNIRAVQKSDSAVFVCIAHNEGGEAKLQVQLNVIENIEKPQLKSLPSEYVPLTNRLSVSLTCSVEGKPNPEITWILPNGTSLLSGTSIFRFHHKHDGTLIIREPSVSEVGRYRCVGHNSAGYVERTVMLESGSKPYISSKYSSLVSIINGENLKLNCLSSGNPLPKLTWTLPNGVVLTRPQQTGRYAVLSDGTLTVQRASVYDRGSYLCQTINDYGSSSMMVSVIVIAYPPRITNGPAAVTYTKPGVSVQLNCMALATPKAEVIWEMPDGIQFKVGTQPRLYGNKYLHPQGSLVIQNPSSRDNGFYKCTAKNVVGSDNRATYVYVF